MRSFVLACLLASGCATIQFAPRKPIALDRKTPPAQIDSSAPPLDSAMPTPSAMTFNPPPIPQETKLKNGVRVLLLEQHATPLVTFGVVLKRGSIEAPAGVFDLFVAWLASGSDLISPKALDSDMFAYAVEHYIDVHRESATVSAQIISPELHDVIRMIMPAFATPSFDADRFEVLVDQHKRKAGRNADAPAARARRELDAMLFPSAAYAETPIGTAHSFDTVTLDQVRALRDTVGADSVAVVVAGDTTMSEVLPQIEAAIGALKPGARASHAVQGPAHEVKPHVVLLDHPGDAQMQIALGYEGVPHDHPDFVALYALSKIAQDAAGSELRLRHGVTYAVSSGMAMARVNAPIVLTSAVDAKRLAEATSDLFGAISKLDARLAKPGELERIKSWIVANQTTYQTVDEAREALATIASLDLPADYWVKFRAAILALTREDILRVAKQYLDPSRAQLVVLGDASLAKSDLDALQIAPVEVRKVEH